MRAREKKVPEISGISDLSKSRGSMAPPAPTSVCGYIQCHHKKGTKGAEEALDPLELGDQTS